ncbi:MAG: hypothetical protein KC766_00275 [Myxococcales bacterium]|nr:hypothetical protein [Myxococcales bacterium]
MNDALPVPARLRARLLELLRVPTPLEWLLLFAGLALTWRYFWFMDDAFVYFRYVDNCLFLGRGLVFNPGEYVEGYSSPLWTLMLMPVRATRLDWYTSLRGLALIFCAAFWATSVWLNRELGPRGPRVSLGTAIAMTHYGVLGYFSSGLETPLVQLAACAFALVLMRPRRRVFQILVGLTPLIRPELTVPTAVLIVALWIRDRRFPRWLVASAAGFGGAWLVFRIYYYADLFPNTYYLKDQTDLSQGYYYFVYSLGSHQLLPVLVAMLVCASIELWLRRRERRLDRADSAEGPRYVRAILLICALSAMVYPLKVGGDMVYYRFLAFPVCAGLLACAGVLEAPLLRIPRANRWLRWAFPALGLGAATLSALAYPSKLTRHPATLEAKVPHFHGIADSAWHRQIADLRPSPERSRYDSERLSQYRKATSEQLEGRRVDTGGWCVSDYRRWDRSLVHEWGLTEPVLARATVKSDRPGHKTGLKGLARGLLLLRRKATENGSLGRGMYRRAVEERYAPAWVAANLEAIEVIERKAFNRHAFFENLGLALKRPRVLIPPPKSRPSR